MPAATAQRQSRTKIHDKIQELSWAPTYATPADNHPTDYTFEKAPKKDPMKQVLRSYFPMEEEKDQRVYGAIDGAIRGNMFSQVQQRWMEWQKLFLSLIPFAEISAARAMPLAINAVPNPEVHNGLAIHAVAAAMEAKPGVSVAYLQSMIRLDAERRLEFDFDELTEAIGEAFDQSAFEEIMSTHCGRMVALDDRMVLFADPEEAADYLGFDLTPVSSERLRVRPARPPDKGA